MYESLNDFQLHVDSEAYIDSYSTRESLKGWPFGRTVEETIYYDLECENEVAPLLRDVSVKIRTDFACSNLSHLKPHAWRNNI